MLPTPPIEGAKNDKQPIRERTSAESMLSENNAALERSSNSTSLHDAQAPYVHTDPPEEPQALDPSHGPNSYHSQQLFNQSLPGASIPVGLDFQTDLDFDLMDPFFTSYELDCTFAPYLGQRR